MAPLGNTLTPRTTPAAPEALTRPKIAVAAIVAVTANRAAVLAFVDALTVYATSAVTGFSLTTHNDFLSLTAIFTQDSVRNCHWRFVFIQLDETTFGSTNQSPFQPCLADS